MPDDKTPADAAPVPAAPPSLFAAFPYDKDAMDTGKWLPFHGGEIKLARVGMPKWRQATREATELHKADLDAAKGNPEATDIIAAKITAYCVVHGLIMDWRGFSEPYSPLTAAKLIDNQPDAREEIFGLANSAQNFRRESAGEAAPNS